MSGKHLPKAKASPNFKHRKFIIKNNKKEHFKRHREAVIILSGNSAFKCYQYRFGYFTYKGKRRRFSILLLNSKKFK